MTCTSFYCHTDHTGSGNPPAPHDVVTQSVMTREHESMFIVKHTTKNHMSTWGPFDTREEARAFAEAKNEIRADRTNPWIVRTMAKPEGSARYRRMQEILNPRREYDVTFYFGGLETTARTEAKSVLEAEQTVKDTFPQCGLTRMGVILCTAEVAA